MPQPETDYIVEASCKITIPTTEVTVEATFCASEGRSRPLIYSAWSDGSNWLDNDGSTVGWTDWPPEVPQ